MTRDDQDRVEKLVKAGTRAAAEKRLTEARELLERALAIDPCHIRGWDTLGFVRYFQGDLEGAVECCHRSLEQKPDGAYAHKGLGICLAAKGEVERGIDELHKAIDLKPEWADPHHDLAVIFIREKRYAEAVPLLERAALLSPGLGQRIRPLLAQVRTKARAAEEQSKTPTNEGGRSAT